MILHEPPLFLKLCVSNITRHRSQIPRACKNAEPVKPILTFDRSKRRGWTIKTAQNKHTHTHTQISEVCFRSPRRNQAMPVDATPGASTVFPTELHRRGGRDPVRVAGEIRRGQTPRWRVLLPRCCEKLMALLETEPF